MLEFTNEQLEVMSKESTPRGLRAQIELERREKLKEKTSSKPNTNTKVEPKEPESLSEEGSKDANEVKPKRTRRSRTKKTTAETKGE